MDNYGLLYNQYGIIFKINGVITFWSRFFKSLPSEDFIKSKITRDVLNKYGENTAVEFIAIKKVNR
jgi:hypothetical protein